MKVHIVCHKPEGDRILQRLANLLASGTGWSLGPAFDPDADLNYAIPYLEVPNHTSTPVAALFTHREDVQPAKVVRWGRAAEQVGLRITWASQYERELGRYGPTRRILPPLDREHFSPREGGGTLRPTLRAGVSGFTYTAGRKGERLLAAVLETDAARGFEWSAIGRGWSLPTNLLPYGQLPEWYRSLDLYVCPSLIEGIPYGPLEALACGIPIVIPRGVGLLDELPELPGITRYSCGDAQDLERALAEAREGLSKPIDRAALRAATDSYTEEGWITGHLEAFSSLSAQPQSASTEARTTARRGIYVVAYGDPARKCAVRLVESVHHHMPGLPVAVASETPLPAADVKVYHSDADLGGRTAKTKMYDLAPKEWEQVLYLDADTELIGDISFLFDVLSAGFEMVCTKDVGGYDLIHSLWRRDSGELRLGMQALGSDRALQLAGGVTGFRRTPATQRFLAEWYKEWHRLARRDQGAMLRALYKHPVRLLVLGNEWNRFEGICKEQSAGIIHHRGGPARRHLRWSAGRLDDPQAWRRGAQRGRVRPLEGSVPPRHPHAGATAVIAYVGPKELRRVSGRSGQAYAFMPNKPQTISAEDALYFVASNRHVWEVRKIHCPVCLVENVACKGQSLDDHRKVSALMEQPKKMRLPKQSSRRGPTGYIGDVDVYDPNAVVETVPEVEVEVEGSDDAKEAPPAADKQRKRRTPTKRKVKKETVSA